MKLVAIVTSSGLELGRANFNTHCVSQYGGSTHVFSLGLEKLLREAKNALLAIQLPTKGPYRLRIETEEGDKVHSTDL